MNIMLLKAVLIIRKLSKNKALLEAMFYNKRVTKDEYNEVIKELTNHVSKI